MHKTFGYGFLVYKAVFDVDEWRVDIQDDNGALCYSVSVMGWSEFRERRVGGFVRRHTDEARLEVLDRVIEAFFVANPPKSNVSFESYSSLFDLLKKYNFTDDDDEAASYQAYKIMYKEMKVSRDYWRAEALDADKTNILLAEKLILTTIRNFNLEEEAAHAWKVAGKAETDAGEAFAEIDRLKEDNNFLKKSFDYIWETFIKLQIDRLHVIQGLNILETRAQRLAYLLTHVEVGEDAEMMFHEMNVLAFKFNEGDFYSEIDLSIPHPVDEPEDESKGWDSEDGKFHLYFDGGTE